MTTRPGYIWSGTEWVAIGQEAIASPFYYQATAPSTPSTGDIWVESDVDVPSIDSTQFLRWRKTAVGGETSLSGTDDNGLSLQYTPNYEQVYINGVLQVRGQDYTATTGTTITGLTALVANDVVEVFSAVARAVADVYTQAQSDSKFATQLNFPASAWTAWTPTLTGITLGNGTVSAKYVKLGKTVIARIVFTHGTTSSITGDTAFSVPVAQAADAQSTTGTAQLFVGGFTTLGWSFIFSDKIYVRPMVANTTYVTSASMSSTVPATWGSGAQLVANIVYESA